MPFTAGTTLNADGGLGNSKDGRGLVGISTNQAGVVGESGDHLGNSGLHGVFGVGHNPHGAGVFGTNDQVGGMGVQGINPSGDGVNGTGYRGVFGSSDTFQGVSGFSRDNAGVFGESQSLHGVYGLCHNPNGGGVYGTNDAGGFAGVFDGNVFMAGTLSVAKDVILTGADCAEHVELVQDAVCEPGTVMAISIDGALDASAQAYDKRVAGVVSGAGSFRPGIVLDRQHSDEARPAVALFGKVYCKVDAEYAPIEVGDLLTTSDTVGHAMKACDPVRAFGAVVGKALGNLTGGRGLIPILITLQ